MESTSTSVERPRVQPEWFIVGKAYSKFMYKGVVYERGDTVTVNSWDAKHFWIMGIILVKGNVLLLGIKFYTDSKRSNRVYECSNLSEVFASHVTGKCDIYCAAFDNLKSTAPKAADEGIRYYCVGHVVESPDGTELYTIPFMEGEAYKYDADAFQKHDHLVTMQPSLEKYLSVYEGNSALEICMPNDFVVRLMVQ